MLCPYALNYFKEQLNVLKVDDNEVPLMEKFAGTKIDITIKIHHTWGCPVYVLDSRLQGNIYGIPKWEPHSISGIYLGHSQLYAGSVPLVLNQATHHVSPQFHIVFDDEFPQLQS